METLGISGNTVDSSCELRKRWSKDALCVSVAALCSGRQGQDLGLPLLHVLGKRPPTQTSGRLQTSFGFFLKDKDLRLCQAYEWLELGLHVKSDVVTCSRWKLCWIFQLVWEKLAEIWNQTTIYSIIQSTLLIVVIWTIKKLHGEETFICLVIQAGPIKRTFLLRLVLLRLGPHNSGAGAISGFSCII